MIELLTDPQAWIAFGVIDHMAFTASDLRAMKARFDQSGVKYDLGRQAGAGTWQLFSSDPSARGAGFRRGRDGRVTCRVTIEN